MQVRVIHNIGDLSSDLAGIAKRVQPDMSKVVRKNVRAGLKLAPMEWSCQGQGGMAAERRAGKGGVNWRTT